MGRQQLDAAVGRHPELNAGAAQLLADDALLDDPAVLRRAWRRTRRSATSGASNCIRSHPAPDLVALLGGARRGQRREIDQRVAGARDALVELDDHLRQSSDARDASRRSRRRPRRGVCRSSSAERIWHPHLGEQPPAAGLGAEVDEPRIGAVHRDAEGQRRCRAPARWCCTGSGGLRAVRDQLGDPARAARGRSSSFSLSGRTDASPTDTSVSRARAWLGMTPGSSAR